MCYGNAVGTEWSSRPWHKRRGGGGESNHYLSGYIDGALEASKKSNPVTLFLISRVMARSWNERNKMVFEEKRELKVRRKKRTGPWNVFSTRVLEAGTEEGTAGTESSTWSSGDECKDGRELRVETRSQEGEESNENEQCSAKEGRIGETILEATWVEEVELPGKQE
ncbi:hypothetical protein R1flu_028124 [Riccia fluitans]|uniref:HMG box domain-containing protein n=1 Tax=Riccia fluitans TaxID=41844 RepID=A0ABD1XNQ5_9MARC